MTQISGFVPTCFTSQHSIAIVLGCNREVGAIFNALIDLYDKMMVSFYGHPPWGLFIVISVSDTT